MSNVRPFPVPNTSSPRLNAALSDLGASIATKQIADKERELERRLGCAQRLMARIEELVAELRDDTLPDYARTVVENSHARARNDYQKEVRAVALLIGEVEELRKVAGKERHVLAEIIDLASRR